VNRPGAPILLAPELPHYHVAIVGAGVWGICPATKLKQVGIPFTIFEKNEEVGGTSYENRYPGARSTRRIIIYQFSLCGRSSRRSEHG
jgi:4-hydroxyacetophenone monooxygenase